MTPRVTVDMDEGEWNAIVRSYLAIISLVRMRGDASAGPMAISRAATVAAMHALDAIGPVGQADLMVRLARYAHDHFPDHEVVQAILVADGYFPDNGLVALWLVEDDDEDDEDGEGKDEEPSMTDAYADDRPLTPADLEDDRDDYPFAGDR